MVVSEVKSAVGTSKSDNIYSEFHLALSYIKPHNSRFLIAVALLTVASMASLATPWFVGNLTEALIRSDLSTETPLLLAWFTVLTVQAISMLLGVLGASNIGQDISAKIHADLYEKILHIEYNYFFGESKGSVVSLFAHEAGVISNYFSSQIISLLPQFLTVIGAIILILNLNFAMGAYICIFATCAFLLLKILGRNLRPLTRSLMDVHARLISRVEQDIQLNVEIKAHNLKNKHRDLFHEINTEQKHTAKEFIRASALISPSIQILGYFTLAFFLFYLGSGLVSTIFSISELVKLILYSLLFLRPVSSISGVIGNTQNVISALERINNFLNSRETEPDELRTIQNCDFQQDIVLDSVTYRYNDEIPPLLDKCNLRIKNGEVTVLTGENGSGKSTLTALVLQLLLPTEGRIYIGKTDLRLLDLNVLRRNISYVRQTEQLFDTSIRENLFHHPTDRTESDIEKVLRALRLWDWINSLPNKLDQKVGEQGILVSGGQAQKIALARTLLEKRKIIILDEATSMLDIETEKKFIGLFRNFVPNSTVIIIAHRPLSSEIADRHIELNDKTVRDILQGSG